MLKEAWYRPSYNVVGFLPPSPGGGLAAGIQQIVREEGMKIGLNIKIAEQSGTTVSALVTSPDLSHSRRGANYTGTCIICGNVYRGETGFGAHTRVCQHKDDIRRNSDTNSMAIHLTETHPEHQGDPDAIIFSVTNTGPKPLEREIREAVQIANTVPTMLMNSRAEYIRPVIQRLAPVDLLDERDRRPGAI